MKLVSSTPPSPHTARLITVTAAAWATIAFVSAIAVGINGIN